MNQRRRTSKACVVVAAAWLALAPSSVAFADPVNPAPSTAGMPGAALWNQVLGWMMQWGLWLSLAAIVLGAGGWWVSARLLREGVRRRRAIRIRPSDRRSLRGPETAR